MTDRQLFPSGGIDLHTSGPRHFAGPVFLPFPLNRTMTIYISTMNDLTHTSRAEILKAISHPTRLEFLEWLRRPEEHFSSQPHPLSMGVCANQFARRCGLSQSTVSAHLASLEKAGLVEINRVGQWSFYHRSEKTIRAFLEDLERTL